MGAGFEFTQATDPGATGAATATDLCDLDPAVTFADSVAGGPCPEGSVITRTWTATDACGNATQCGQTITVRAPADGVAIEDPHRVGSDLVFSFLAEAGRSYAVQFTLHLNPSDWMSLTNVTGSGVRVTLTNAMTGDLTGFYRVATQ